MSANEKHELRFDLVFRKNAHVLGDPQNQLIGADGAVTHHEFRLAQGAGTHDETA
jgi:hypothetical protein